MDNLAYLLAAFIFIWAVLFAYLFVLSNRQNQIRREVQALAEQVRDDRKTK